jgi:hypothetical protein
MLTTIQLFIDGLHFVVMAITLLSHVINAIISNLLWTKFIPIIVILIQVVGVGLTTNMM